MTKKLLIGGVILLIAEGFWLSRDLKDKNQEKPRATALGEISMKNNDVEIRENDQLYWAQANVKQPVYPNDAILTHSKSQAQVTLNDSTTLMVYENSLVLIEPSQKPDGPLRIETRKGSYRAIVAAGHKIETDYGVIQAKEQSEILIKVSEDNRAVFSLVKGLANLKPRDDKQSKENSLHEIVLEQVTEKLAGPKEEDLKEREIIPLPLMAAEKSETEIPQVEVGPIGSRSIAINSRSTDADDMKQYATLFPKEKEIPVATPAPLPPPEVEADEKIVPPVSTPTTAPTPRSVNKNFALYGGLTSSLGTGSDNQGLIPSRSLVNYTALVDIGWRISSVTPLIQGEYFKTNQLADPNTLSNQNLASSGYLLSLGAKFEHLKWSLGLGYDFFGTRTMAFSSSASQSISYSNPQGYFGQLGYDAFKKITLFIRYRHDGYSQVNDGSQVSISSNQLEFSEVGLGVLYRFY